MYVAWQKRIDTECLPSTAAPYNQTKQLLRKVFPGSKKCLHVWDLYDVFTLCLSVYDVLYRSWWQVCTRNLERHIDSNIFGHGTGLTKQCHHWWSVTGIVTWSVTVSTSLVLVTEWVTGLDTRSGNGTQEYLGILFVFVTILRFPRIFLTHWGRVMQICVFTLQLRKANDANLRF